MKIRYMLVCVLMPHVVHAMELQDPDKNPELEIFRGLVFPEHEGNKSPFGDPTGKPIPIPSDDVAQQFVNTMMMNQKNLSTCTECKILADELCATCKSIRTCFNCSKIASDALCDDCQSPAAKKIFEQYKANETFFKTRNRYLCDALCIVTQEDAEFLQILGLLKNQVHPETLGLMKASHRKIKRLYKKSVEKYSYREVYNFLRDREPS